jgi:hypothetical protein
VKIRVGAGMFTCADLQQICWSQSELVWQVFWQEVEQIPLQQISLAAVLQSVDCEQSLGQALYAGFRQRPLAVIVGSTSAMVVQQTSPVVVLQSLLVAQVFGHSEGGRQNGWL